MASAPAGPRGHRAPEYEQWVKEQQIPIHRGYFVNYFNRLGVSPWNERGTRGCFRELAGQEGTPGVQPNNWFHRHFDLGDEPAKMLAMHRSRLHPGLGDNVVDYEKNEIQYWQEDPSIREIFEQKLAERGFQSRMPPEYYTDKSFNPTWGRQGKKFGDKEKGCATDFASHTEDYLKERQAELEGYYPARRGIFPQSAYRLFNLPARFL